MPGSQVSASVPELKCQPGGVSDGMSLVGVCLMGVSGGCVSDGVSVYRQRFRTALPVIGQGMCIFENF